MKVKKQSKSLKKIIPENIKYFIKYVIVMPLIESEARHSLLNLCRIIIGNCIRKTDIIFYDRFSNHYSFTKPIIDEVSKVKKTILIVGEPSHKLITHNTNKNIKVYYVSNKYQLYLRYLNTKVFVTVASGFENKFKPKKPICIHIFHSIVSMHLVYGLSSFDAYDVFFAVGPHHVNEFNALAKSRKWSNKKIEKVGYVKIDELALLKNKYTKKIDKPVIVIAPSWGKYNILRTQGKMIVEELNKAGFYVIVRPHPHSYDYDLETVNEIIKYCLKTGQCNVDGPVADIENMLEADIMISDWSGVAFEYSFAAERPVVFLDVKQKMHDDIDTNIKLPAMEDIARREIGVVTNIDSVVNVVKDMMNNKQMWKEQIRKTRKNYLYNYGNAKVIASKKIIELSS